MPPYYDSMVAKLVVSGTTRNECLMRLRREMLRKTDEEIFSSPETTVQAALRGRGFSRRIVDHFFRPWIGGAMLDTTLSGSSRMFEFLFRMFALGEAAVPDRGMGAIPAQLASRLPAGCLRLGVRVEAVEPGCVTLPGGERRTARAVVVAAEAAEAVRLLRQQHSVPWRPVWCFYFAAREVPFEEPLLVLSGGGARAAYQVGCLRVLARDVSLTTVEPRQTSIQNHFPCEIESVAPDAHPSQLLVRVRCGASLLLARITRRAYADLGLQPGAAAWVQVKSVALVQ